MDDQYRLIILFWLRMHAHADQDINQNADE
jgi:hypothetical protein